MEVTTVTNSVSKTILLKKQKNRLPRHKIIFIERRRYPRKEANLPIKISDQEFDIVTETKNISGNGVYCSVDKDIPLMSRLRIILLIPIRKNKKRILKRINCEGVLVRKEPLGGMGRYSYNIGIYFNEIKESDRKVILAYMNPLVKFHT